MLSCTLVLGCFTQYPTYTRQPAVDYSTKYADKLEPSATLIMSGYLFTVEKTTDGKYIRKEFFPDTRQIIKFQTFADKELSVPEGLYKSWWDDGVQTSEGMYVNGKQNGDWTSWSEKNVSKGKYVNGKQEGLWIGIDSLGNKRSEINFAAGKRNGPFKDWDKTGELVREGT